MGAVITFGGGGTKFSAISLMIVLSIPYLLFVIRQLALTLKSYTWYKDILPDNLHHYFT